MPATAHASPFFRRLPKLPNWPALVGILLICLILFQAIQSWCRVEWMQIPSLIIMVAMVPYLILHGSKVGKVFVVLSIIIALVAFFRLSNAPEVLAAALLRAAFFQAFLTAVFTLQEAANRSTDINRVGLYLISQPLRKQSILTLLGTNLMALMMNMGSLVIIGALARDRMKNDETRGTGTTERGWMTAVAAIRGFSPSATWSPLALPPVFLSSLYLDLSLGHTMQVGFAISVIILTVSCLFTYLEASLILRRGGVPYVDAVPFPGHSILKILLLLTGIFTSIYFIAHGLDISTSAAAFVIIPVTSCLWILLGRGYNISELINGPMKNMVFLQLPTQAAGTSVIVSAAFLGPVLVELLPMDQIAQAVLNMHLSAFTLMALVFITIMGLAMIGLSPVLTTTLAIAVIGDPSNFGLSPITIVAILLTAWALAAQFSPYTGTATIASRMFEVSVERLVLVRNGPFMVLTLILVLFGIFCMT